MDRSQHCPLPNKLLRKEKVPQQLFYSFIFVHTQKIFRCAGPMGRRLAALIEYAGALELSNNGRKKIKIACVKF